MNSARRPLIAGNWKMNVGGPEAMPLAAGVARAAKEFSRVEVVVAPPYTALAAAAHELAEAKSEVGLAAQNMHPEVSGAFTGEISAGMLRDSGASWVIVGHSERRQLFGETDEMVTRKVAAAIAAEIRPIACVGETLEEREAGQTLAVVERQVRAFLDELAKAPGFGVVAYEPVWAIGTGKVASPADAQEVHAMIRGLLARASIGLASATRVLYGGSVKADNAVGLLEQADIDGALVGGASLDAAGFRKIIEAAHRLAEREEQE
ncbi:triose-phosphate isomerase [Chondromyces apiculatus]|uniref:Triosephosphate isomerase n=1 Tax=Chondromyces apiculatus DSM 436 TaxID=1192034 RepID=A0A017T3Y3_9BACT|nr:triose-phosphate isomerase [Chondromyces apiculatus]EYF03276.1 Triosephosphate isomerase [Chondromyces apiculatus DSM 436]